MKRKNRGLVGWVGRVGGREMLLLVTLVLYSRTSHRFMDKIDRACIKVWPF